MEMRDIPSSVRSSLKQNNTNERRTMDPTTISDYIVGISIAVGFVAFLILVCVIFRETICWYFKTSEISKTLKDILAELKKQNQKQEPHQKESS